MLNNKSSLNFPQNSPPLSARPKKRRFLSTWQVLALGYLLIISVGALLLALPIASKSGEWTGAVDAFFSSTAAMCAVGLNVFDPSAHWSLFGKFIILLLIQIGGLGFMTVICMLNLLMKRKVGVYERKILLQSSGNDSRFSGAIHLVRRIVLGTLLFETVGTVLLSIQFCQDFGFWDGLFCAVFHSVSAFCNAGIDILGRGGSLTAYSSNPLVILTVSALIIVGGIGFVVWNDLLEKSFRFKKISLHSKIVLVSSTVLHLVPMLLFYLFEFQHSFSGFSAGKQFLSSLFLAVSPRSAGFYTVKIEDLSGSSCALLMFLMLIGGSSGSTAGGIKTTTFVVLCAGLISSVKNRPHITVARRKIEPYLLRQAATILTFYLMTIMLSLLVLCAIEPQPFLPMAMEVFGAVCTVGLSFGITPSLCAVSKVFLMVLMYAGRLGLLSFALALGGRRKEPPIQRPAEHIMVG